MKVFARILIISVLYPFIGIGQSSLFKTVSPILKNQVLANAKIAMTEKPITVTAQQCERSAGGVHDFYSEGDYWWQNPDNPNGPYIQRDGQSNPDNFVAHRKAMIRFSQIIGTLASAYMLTKDEKYVKKAFEHLNAWFVDINLLEPSQQRAVLFEMVAEFLVSRRTDAADGTARQSWF
jgi:hypothetical protein